MAHDDPRGKLLRALRRHREALRAEEEAGVRWHLVEGASPAERLAPPGSRGPSSPAPRRSPPPAPPGPGAPSPTSAAPPAATPAPVAAGAVAALAAVAEEVSRCTACGLHRGRTLTVPGEGNPRSPVVFVGEGPGEQEDLSGRPFVGRAGRLLRTLIEEELGVDPSEVFIANIVKCRPPNNRAPTPEEAAACLPFLRRQVAAVRPRILVTLGNPSTQSLLQTKEGITRLRGRPLRRGPFLFVPTFHPSYLLRNPAALPTGREDFRLVRGLLDGSAGAP